MPAREPELDLPADFEQRCSTTLAQLEAGSPMTIEQIANTLGLSYEFFAVALATYAATRGVPAMVDFSPPRPLH